MNRVYSGDIRNLKNRKCGGRCFFRVRSTGPGPLGLSVSPLVSSLSWVNVENHLPQSPVGASHWSTLPLAVTVSLDRTIAEH